jgi:Domain of unknown function (DUF5666)
MSTTRTTRILTLGAGLILAASLAACGGSSSHTNTATSPTTAGKTASGSGTGNNGTGGSGGGNFPGASGSVAAITGSSMEVQNQQAGQVTVSWTSSTTFSKTVTLSAANVAAGDCVTVTGSTSTGTLVANSVTVSKPTSSGSCTNGFGARRPGGGAGFPGGTAPNGGSRPTGSSLPNAPSGSAPRGASGFSFTSGKVTSVTPATMVIYGFSSSGFSGTRGTQSSTPPTSIPSTSVNIELQNSTTYSETQSTAASSLAVGDCVSAVGSTDSTGAVTARTVRITSTGGQTCSSGFGGFARGGAANG